MDFSDNQIPATPPLPGGPVPERITAFIRRHHVMTVATADDRGLWCANLFYAYLPQYNIFVFTTETTTRHGAGMAADGRVAASIVLETRHVGSVQGLQIDGTAQPAGEGEIFSIARKAYIKRFPYAVLAELSLWVLRPAYMKLTDNRLGFGKKLHWPENNTNE